MQGWPTVGDKIVREVLFGYTIDLLLVGSRLEGGGRGVVLLVAVHHESTGVIVTWERGCDGAGWGHRHVIRII